MNDGVELLLERMKTNPEEFYGDYNKWTEVISKFERFLNEDDLARIYGEIGKLRRDEFTRVVMQEILREPTPVEIDPSTYTINTVGRANWGSSTLSIKEAVLKEQEARMQQAMLKEYSKIQLEATDTQTKQKKNQTKMEQLLKRVTGSKY
jgi:hypothetical protein